MVAFRTPERKPLSKGSEGLRTEFKKHPKGGLQKVPRGLRGRASELRHSSPGPQVPRCRGVVCVPPQVGPQPSGARRGCLGSLGEAPRCEMARGWPGQPELQPVTLRLHCGMARSQRFRGWKQEAAAAEGQGYPQRRGQSLARTGRSIHIFRRNEWFCGPSPPRGPDPGTGMCAMGGRGAGGVKHKGCGLSWGGTWCRREPRVLLLLCGPGLTRWLSLTWTQRHRREK